MPQFGIYSGDPQRMAAMLSGGGPGSELPVFIGARRQIGGGIFTNFIRSAVPYVRSAFKAAAPTLRKIGKKVGKKALKAATLAVGDALSGERSLGEALSSRAREQALRALGRAPEDASISASAINDPEAMEEAMETVESGPAKDLGITTTTDDDVVDKTLPQLGSGGRKRRRRRASLSVAAAKRRRRQGKTINKRRPTASRKGKKKKKRRRGQRTVKFADIFSPKRR